MNETSSRLGDLPHQDAFLAYVARSAVTSLTTCGPGTTVGLRTSGFATASSHGLPSQTCLGIGAMAPAMLRARNRASCSLSVTSMVLGSGVLNEAVRSTTVVRATQLFSFLLAWSHANWKSAAVIGLPSLHLMSSRSVKVKVFPSALTLGRSLARSRFGSARQSSVLS